MLLSVCSDYGLEHDIKFNSAKSNIMIFCCKKFKDIPVPSFELNDNILPRVNQCKYIGYVITDDLKDDNDIARQYKRIYAQGNALTLRASRAETSAGLLRAPSVTSRTFGPCYRSYLPIFAAKYSIWWQQAPVYIRSSVIGRPVCIFHSMHTGN